MEEPNTSPKHLDTLCKNVFVDLVPAGPDVENVDPLLYEMASSDIMELLGEIISFAMSLAHLIFYCIRLLLMSRMILAYRIY
jgi:hypothetical protein